MMTEFKEKDEVAAFDRELEEPWDVTEHSNAPVRRVQESRGTDELMRIMAKAAR